MFRFGLLILSVSFLGACSGLSKSDCTDAKLETTGYEYGKKGLAEEEITGLQKFCEKKKIDLSLEGYKASWLRGIREYCAESNAFQLGLKNKDAKLESCPIEFRSAFERSYKKGTELYDLEMKLNKVDEKLESLKAEKRRLEENLEKADKNLKKLNQEKDSLVGLKKQIL